MRIGRLEFGYAPLGVNFIPEFFLHKDVFFDDEKFADEYGIFLLGARVSLYVGSRTLSQVRARKMASK